MSRRSTVNGGARGWPGTSSQLASGAGTVVDIGSGLAKSGSSLIVQGTRNPLDASTKYAWYMTGSEPFANQGTGGTLAFAKYRGTGGTSNGRCYRNTSSLTSESTNYTTDADYLLRAASASVPVPSAGGGLTMEAVVSFDTFGQVNGTTSNVLGLTDGATNNILTIEYHTTSGLGLVTKLGSSARTSQYVAFGNGNGQVTRGVHHLMMTYIHASGSSYPAMLWVDGVCVAKSTGSALSATLVEVLAYSITGISYDDVRISTTDLGGGVTTVGAICPYGLAAARAIARL